MKNTTILLVVVLLLLGGAAAWYMSGEDKKTGSTYKTEDMSFAVDPDLILRTKELGLGLADPSEDLP